MLHDLFGIALIAMGALTIYARVLARSTEFCRPLREPAPHCSPDYDRR
jgi:hypothetical protein